MRKFEFSKLKIAVGYFALLFLILFLGTKVFGFSSRFNPGPSGSVKWNEVIERIPQYLIISLICTIIGFQLDSKLKKKKNDEYICDKCNKLNKDKAIHICECGGRFIFIDSMKWVSDDSVENNEEFKSN